VSTSDPFALARRLNVKFYHIALLFVAAFLILSSFRPMMDNVDLGWHVAQGRWMIQHAAVYRRDMMNYPNLGRPAVDEYPLFQLVLYFFWKLGWWGPSLLAAVVYAFLVGTLAWAARNFLPGGSALFLLTLGTMILYIQLAFVLRPHLVTYLCLVILGVFLLRHREAARWTTFWPMALLQIAWTNSHSAFVLGPAMVGLFGFEMILRHSWMKRAPAWATARVWAGAFLLILIACLVNPFGFSRFYPPFFQADLESIRSYVSEMRPLTGGAASLYDGVTLTAGLAVILAIVSWRGAVSWSLLLLAILFYGESLSVEKSWAVFGVFPPLLILSCGAFGAAHGKWAAPWWCSLAGTVAVGSLILAAIFMRLDGTSSNSLKVLWSEYDLGRRELSYPAVKWMKAHQIEGRLFHRCEDGGYLQLVGYDHGETFGDTGFGKYDANFIHIVAMAGERPALVPLYLTTYQPAYVVTNNFCYQWPYYLRQQGWRQIFYSPYGAVWTRPGTRPDLATVPDEAIDTAFTQDIAQHGRPDDLLIFGRNIIALNSNGREDLAVKELTSLPADFHHVSWYWEAARILSFEPPRISAQHRQQLVDEADRLHDDDLTAEFRALARADQGDSDGARKILAAVPPAELGTRAGDLLLKIDLDQGGADALALANRLTGFDPRDGEHWEYVAMAEERAGLIPAAARDWERAVFYYPDEPDLMANARQFALRNHDQKLLLAVEAGPDLKVH
jgi:hypothetical protein